MLTLSLGALSTGCSRSDPALRQGEPVPDISLPGADGVPMSVPGARRGQVLLIHFWADWCPLCIEELHNSRKLAERYRQKGLYILAINLQQAPEQVDDLLGRLDLNYPVLFDREGMAGRRFGVTGLPMSYLIDREGRLHRRIVGAMAPQQLEGLLQAMF